MEEKEYHIQGRWTETIIMKKITEITPYLQSNVKSKLYPGSIQSLMLTEGILVGAQNKGYDLTCGLADRILIHFPK